MRFLGRSGVVSAIVACACWGLVPSLAAAETSDSAVSGISGTGVTGISGTGAQGISGTGVTGITGTGALGITGTGVTGITGTGALGITGTGVTGITGTGALGITGTGVTGITGTGALGITGTGVTGITGTGALGITGTGVTGITGTGALGITGTGVTGITGTGALGITGTGVTGITGTGALEFSDQQVLVGPVESIDPENGLFVSMGQYVMASAVDIASLSVGDYVSVDGSVVSSGWLYADSVAISNQSYAAGSDQVFVTGIPSAIDYDLGRAMIGNLEVDYTPALSGSSHPRGDILAFGGIQPNDKGLVISDSFLSK